MSYCLPGSRLMRAALLCVALFLIATVVGGWSALAQDSEPEIGDFIYCSPNIWFPDFSMFGHGAIYVGSLGDPFGDVVERTPSGIHFTTLAQLRIDYRSVRFASVVAVPQSVRTDAATRAVEVASAIKIGTYLPWYSEPYDLGSRNCIGTFKKFYLDAHANADQVGSPDDPALPSDAYHRYQSGYDWDQTVTGNGGVLTGGYQGGIESRPLWLHTVGGAIARSAESPGPLEELMPDSAFGGDVGYPVIPEIGDVSNAMDAAGKDYVDGATGKVIASILATETINSVYEHDYAVCARVRHLEVNDMYAIPTDTTWWWTVSTILPSADSSEVMIPLTIQLDGASAVIDSRYPAEHYGSISGTVLNYQVRGINLFEAMYLVEGIIRAAGELYSLTFANNLEPAAATVFMRSARYERPNIELVVENREAAHSVRFYGTVWTEPRSGAAKWIDQMLTVSAGVSTATLPVGAMYDAVIYAEDGAFLDKAYVPSGFWFSFNDAGAGGTSEVSIGLSELEHSQIATADTNFVSPPVAEMTGHVTDVLPWSYIGIAYSPKQDRQPIDVSSDYGIAFYAKGDGGQYRVKLESAAVTDNDYHGASFIAPAGWQRIVIPFSQLHQEGWGTSVPWTGTDLRTISFVTTNRPLASVDLLVDRICFTQTQITSADPVTPVINRISVRNVPNPFHGATEFIIAIPSQTPMKLDVFDVNGRHIRTIIDKGDCAPGEYRISWDGQDSRGRAVTAGIYFYQLQTQLSRMGGKTLLLR